jgi:hypothetical protein
VRPALLSTLTHTEVYLFWSKYYLLAIIYICGNPQINMDTAYHIGDLEYLPIIRGPFAAISIHHMQAVGVP